MNTIAAFVNRNKFVVFVVLAYLLSWWGMLMPGGGLLPHGPMLAALIVIWLCDGKAGLKSWWSRLWHFGTSWQWYLVAIAIPVGLSFTAAGLNIWLGAQMPAQIDWTIPLQVLPIMLLLSGMWEEPGWTGFALPHLYERFGPSATGTLAATLVVGVVRAIWHLPLVFSGSIPWPDLIFIVAFQIVLTWLFNSSGGSVLAVMLSHLTNNIISGEFFGTWFTGVDSMNQAWLRGGLWILMALILLLVAGFRLGRKSEQQLRGNGVGEPVTVQ